MKKLLFLLPIALILTSCPDPEELKVSPLSISIAQEAGSATFEILSNTNWSIEVNSGWLNVNPSHGRNDAIITLNCTENNAYETRTAMITISGNEKTATVSVTQDAKSGFQMNWIEKTNMPVERSFISPNACIVDGKIYVIGGVGSEGILNTTEEYDPTTDSWTSKAPLSAPRFSHIAEQVDGKIYVMGGAHTTEAIAASDMEVYDVSTDTWSSLGDMPAASLGLGSCVVDGKIYVLGGKEVEPGGPTIDRVARYDPVTNTWMNLEFMPTPKAYFSTVEVNGKIYAIGGVSPGTKGSPTDTINVYDIVSDTWSEVLHLNVPRWGTRSCSVDELIVCVGGYLGPTDPGQKTVEIINTSTGVITESTSMLYARAEGSICQLNGKIYVFGGTTIAPTVYGYSDHVQEGSIISP